MLRASPIRQFAYGDIAFQYPASFTWEADVEGDETKTWTLSGNDFKIMYFILPEAVSVEVYSRAMAERIGEGNTRVSDTERTFGSQKHKGKRLVVTLAGAALNVEVYALRAKSGSRLLVLQDGPPDGRRVSEEGEKALALLAGSFKDAMPSRTSDPGGDK